jgi:hypothetical protein
VNSTSSKNKCKQKGQQGVEKTDSAVDRSVRVVVPNFPFFVLVGKRLSWIG